MGVAALSLVADGSVSPRCPLPQARHSVQIFGLRAQMPAPWSGSAEAQNRPLAGKTRMARPGLEPGTPRFSVV
jgi:hypothetical protein